MSDKNPGGLITSNPTFYNRNGAGQLPSNIGGFNPAYGSAAPGVWAIDQVQRATASNLFPTSDPYFTNTTLLLNGNGTNGAKNNTFIDSSPVAATVTATGTPTQGTFSPFGKTLNGGSVYMAGNAAFNVPAGLQSAFAGWGGRTRTFECWIYRTTSDDGSLQNAYAAVPYNGRWLIGIYSNSLLFGWTDSPSSQQSITTVAKIPVGKWSFISVSVDSRTITKSIIYLGINGVVEAFGNIDLSTQTSSYGWNNMFEVAAYTANNYVGFFSNLRWSSSVRYNANYAVPTAPFVNDANTLLLFGGSNYFVDRSSNAYAMSAVTGTPAVQSETPFSALFPYLPSRDGGSGYFNGSTDYLIAGATDVGTQNFTLEFWVNSTSFAGISIPIYTTSGGANVTSIAIQINASSGVVIAYVSSAGGSWNIISGATIGTIQLNTWNHVALVRNGSDFTGYINGVSSGTLGTSASALTTFDGFSVGAAVGSYYLPGFITGLRQVVGTALYTASFTPPTAPPTAVTNTKLLLNFTNAAIADLTRQNLFNTVGTAQVSTTQKKYGTASVSLPAGTNAGSLLSGSTQVVTTTGPFTWECWFYSLDNSKWHNLWIDPYYGYGTVIHAVSVNPTFGFSWFSWRTGFSNIGAFATNQSVTLNTWTHLAITRDSNNVWRFFINGVLQSYTATSAIWIDVNYGPYVTDGIAITGWNVGASQYNGNSLSVLTECGNPQCYIDDERVTNFCRYIANFTPPTSELQNK